MSVMAKADLCHLAETLLNLEWIYDDESPLTITEIEFYNFSAYLSRRQFFISPIINNSRLRNRNVASSREICYEDSRDFHHLQYLHVIKEFFVFATRHGFASMCFIIPTKINLQLCLRSLLILLNRITLWNSLTFSGREHIYMYICLLFMAEIFIWSTHVLREAVCSEKQRKRFWSEDGKSGNDRQLSHRKYLLSKLTLR